MSGETHIIAIRHGETDWNAATRIQGHTDIALNAQGRWQAQRLGQALAGEKIDCIYSSDLSRARDTAQAIQQLHPVPRALHIHLGLRERSFGIFEGLTHAEIAQDWPDEHRRWIQREPHFAPPGGETPSQLEKRVRDTVAAIARAHTGQRIVLVSHGGIIDMIYRLATQCPLEAPRTWEVANAAIHRLHWHPQQGLGLALWGDVRHLDDSHNAPTGIALP